MKRQRPEPQVRKSFKRLHKDNLMIEQQPQKATSRAPVPKSLPERVFDRLDWMSRSLNQADVMRFGEQSLVELTQLFMLVSAQMTLEDLHNLEYSNRLCYIKAVIERRKLRGKDWQTLLGLIEKEIGRVQKLYQGYFENIDFLVMLKHKYSHSFQRM